MLELRRDGRLWLLAAAVSLVSAALGHAADSLPYQLTIDSALDVKSPGQPKAQPVTSSTVIEYQVERKESSDEVTVSSIEVKILSDGRTLQNSRLTADGLTSQTGPKDETRVSAQQAPAALKQILEQLGTPIARISRDAEGAEESRELLIEANSVLVQNGIIENTQLFEVKFPPSQDQWESKGRISMGNGQFAQGMLTYKKGNTSPEGLVTVEVSGDLKAEGVFGQGEIKNGKYQVTGQQVYGAAQKAWVSGNLDIDASFSLESAGNEAGTVTGKMKIRLEIPSATESTADADKPISSNAKPEAAGDLPAETARPEASPEPR